MTTFTDASALARHQRERMTRIHRSMDTATKEAGEIAKAEAEKLTSGGLSASTLAAMGHPYAKSRAAQRFGARTGRTARVVAAPLLPINKQSGRLLRSWRLFRRSSGSDVVYRLQNMAPHGRFVLSPEGTKTAIARGFWDELNRRSLPKIRKAHIDEWRKALRG